jgi:peptidoglycan/LPS O-acetylase OafA/YrhL
LEIKGRIDSFDSLRGIASVIVIIFHCLISFPIFYFATYEDKYNSNIVKLFIITPLHTIWAGNEAVLLFFVLSGFVLSIPFLNNKESNYFAFVVNRFCRIYIPYIIIMFLSSLLMMLFADYKNIDLLSETYNSRWDHPITFKAVEAYILMINYDTTNVNGVVWTLYHEMRVSLFFPLIMVIIVKYNWKKSLFILIASIIFLFNILGLLSNFFTNGLLSDLIFSTRDTVYYTTFFIIGILLAKFQKQIKSLIKPMNIIKKVFLLLLSLSLINFRWMLLIYKFNNAILKDIIPVLGIVILFGLVLSCGKLDLFLAKSYFLFLGKISYSLYLVHIPVLMISSLYLSKIIPLKMAFLLIPFLSIPIAYLVNRFIEIPSIKLGKKLTKRLTNKSNKKKYNYSA